MRSLIQPTSGLIAWEPDGRPWNTQFLQDAFDINVWKYIYHEAGHGVVAEINGLTPESVRIAWSGGGTSTLNLKLEPTHEHRMVCVAGGAVTNLMHGQYGDLAQVLDSSFVSDCTHVDRRSYKTICGGNPADFDPDMLLLEEQIRSNAGGLCDLLNATANVIYEEWLAVSIRKGQPKNPFEMTWTDVLSHRQARFGI